MSNTFSQPFAATTKSNAQIINARSIINGEDDGLMQVAPLKHQFADDIFKKMLANTWVPQEVQMAKDIEMWESKTALSDQERYVYKRSLAFVSNLDGIQTNNLVHNIARHITSPEVKLVIVRQAFEEALHVHSYATMVEALNMDPEEVYGLYRHDQGLYEKNAYVLQAVNAISDNNFETGTFEADQMFLEACVGNIILEGVYFYSAFLNFYTLKRNNKMPGSAEMIQFINRDEDLHLVNFIQITNAIKEEQPELWTPEFQAKMEQSIKGAVEMETAWGVSCIGDGILGLNKENLTQYLQFVGNMRLKAIGLKSQWDNVENPFPWIDEMTQGSMQEVNFFEGRVREYATGTLEWD
ncbi:ribonucleotide-diphosphate reductase subunit beta [Candidatus Peregrinibacteria bacterium]|jgi:ribonucleoside-diphosphate reductase beta chain|nr:ribonucleotide-diphosphate reductase subunit beta [Candidatus Peregrinibacteria bacterium]